MHKFLSLILLLMLSVELLAQNISGIVTDKRTDKPIRYANVFYEGMPLGVNTDAQGMYTLPLKVGKTLVVQYFGYEKQTFKITSDTRRIDVELTDISRTLKEAEVRGRKKKYSRKNNPAVELMKKVIAAKKKSDLHRYPYFSYNMYKKLTFSFNDVSDHSLKEGVFSKMPFLSNHVEICPETGKRILPITFQETTQRQIWRKSPSREKTIITGQREEGINKFFASGDILNSVLADCFTDVDIYDDNVRLLRHQFISPISSRNAISFYRFYIQDTLMVGDDKCIEVTFVPNNPQDFGFSGSLFIMADSSYRVRQSKLQIPHSSDVNFVEQLNVNQEFIQLPSGDQVMSRTKMTVQLSAIMDMARMQVQLTNDYTDYSLAPIPDKDFRYGGQEYIEPNAELQSNAFWQENRTDSLTYAESKMGVMIKEFESMNNFNVFMFILKAFVENYVETSSDPHKPSYVDIGPVNTIFSINDVEGFRLRASAQTTANLNPHLFAKGYVAYGFKDTRVKGMGELTYAFNKRAYQVLEFPKNNLSVSFQSDITTPTNRFSSTNNDNIFSAFRVTKLDQMMYYNRFTLNYDREWANGFGIELEVKRQQDEAAGALFYQRLDGNKTPSQDASKYQQYFNTAEFKVGLSFTPGAKYINTKQRRTLINNEAPSFTLSHTIGVNALGGEQRFNLTEATIYKRFWLPSAWGRVDAYLKGGIQWNRVPFPLLCMPEANPSYIVHKRTFMMLNDMEFLNDRYVSLMVNWNLNGKVFNRIPLLRKLKWRELLGVNVLWGSLDEKNNPYANPNDSRLFYFPGHFENGVFKSSSYLMEHDKPYVEVYAGVYNIFKILQIEVVRRLNYLYLPDAKKWGWRMTLALTF